MYQTDKAFSYQDQSDMTQPYQVRTGCGHVVTRRMRPSTAGVPYTPETVIEAPNGAPCANCGRIATGQTFNVGDRVTFTNDYGVEFPGKVITGSEYWEWSHSPTVQRYFFEPSDAPWFSVPARNLTAVA